MRYRLDNIAVQTDYTAVQTDYTAIQTDCALLQIGYRAMVSGELSLSFLSLDEEDDLDQHQGHVLGRHPDGDRNPRLDADHVAGRSHHM